MTTRAAALGLAFALAGGPALADDPVVKVMPLKHRTADDLIPVLLPLAGPDGSVTGLDTRLVVRARPAALARIEEAVRALDTPPRQLWITVRQGLARGATSRSAEASGRVGIGECTTVVRPGSGPGGTTTIEARRGRTVVTGSLGQQTTTDSGSDEQRLLVIEGGRAFIRTGESVPQPGVLVTGDPPLAVPGTVYAEAIAGFYVRPRLAGDVVTLEIEVAGDRPAGAGGVDTQRVRSTISGRLGDWIDLAGVLREATSLTAEPLGLQEDRVSERRSVQVRVDEAP
jgi:hypothetical protein